MINLICTSTDDNKLQLTVIDTPMSLNAPMNNNYNEIATRQALNAIHCAVVMTEEEQQNDQTSMVQQIDCDSMLLTEQLLCR
jgi:hypothetical protein